MARSLSDLLSPYPPPLSIPPEAVPVPERILVVLDDDPTGTQSVADLPVLLDWSVDSLVWGLSQGAPAVYVMTNSRSLDATEAAHRNQQVADAAYDAAERLGVRIDFVSRSDSTLRGHFPLEPDVLARAVADHEGLPVDGVVLVPAFPDAGRITVGGTHYAGNPRDGYAPAGETEFARDATFGYRASRLADWVEEKTRGRWRADEVIAIDLAALRTDLDAVVAQFRAARESQPIVADIADEADMRQLAIALAAAEAAGSRFLCRVGPPFPRARIGQTPRPPLTRDDIARLLGDRAASDVGGGLVVVGSHVALTTRQLDRFRERARPVEVEIDVTQVLTEARNAHLDAVVAAVTERLPHATVMISTSRRLVTGADPETSLALARAVSAAVVEVVRRTLAACPPRFVVAKGGITSSDVAALGLAITRAVARGPMLPGIVSLWEPMDGPAQGIPYVVFPGNVGDDASLVDVVAKFTTD